MKFYAILLCLLVVLGSCKDENSRQVNEQDFETGQNDTSTISDSDSERSAIEASNEGNKDEALDSTGNDFNNRQESSTAITSGITYVKTNVNDANCTCYCLQLAMDNNTELCLLEDEMYVNARYAKAGSNVNIYFRSPSSKNKNAELPWDDFDTNTPIAVLSPGENGEMNLDWKGFTVEGELAVDYAVYGKKTLEGTYKKQ